MEGAHQGPAEAEGDCSILPRAPALQLRLHGQGCQSHDFAETGGFQAVACTCTTSFQAPRAPDVKLSLAVLTVRSLAFSFFFKFNQRNNGVALVQEFQHALGPLRPTLCASTPSSLVGPREGSLASLCGWQTRVCCGYPKRGSDGFPALWLRT